MIGSNFPSDPTLIKEETTFNINDSTTSPNARKKRMEQLIQVDPLNGSVSIIGNLPADQFGFLQYDQTFDEIRHRYIFAGTTKDGVASLFSIDANTGSVIYSPPVPASANAIDKDNVIQFR